jgi:nucleotide sugar dehydrogenase
MSYTVAVVGLGKVGLPLAVQYASKGAKVIGCDINPTVVEMVNRGVTPIGDEAHLQDKLREAHEAGLIAATTETSDAVSQADVVVIIVPLMVDRRREIDFAIIDSATAAVGKGLTSGTVVIYETTLPVGTTRTRHAVNLEIASGLKAGEDFFVAFSPERIRTGRIFSDLATYPKVVGGLTEADTEKAARFYESVLDAEIMRVSSAESAELTKLMETAFRDVNIALANEFAAFAAARGIDVHEGIAAANSQPQSMIHEPGIGVGGHCIPVYPYFMINNATGGELQLSRAARTINDHMPRYALDLVKEQLDRMDDRRAVILGLSYRANVKEAAFSMTHIIAEELERDGVKVDVCDPMFTDDEIRARGLTPVGLDAIENYPIVVVQAFHEAFRELPEGAFQNAKLILDGRGDLDPATVGGASVRFLRIGQP